MAAKNQKFFDERTDESEVKARIIEKYFSTWANVVMGAAATRDNKIAYFDLYAGPGRYKDGSKSTPLLVLEKAIAHPKMSQMLVAMFNDSDEAHTSTLQGEIDNLKGIENLKYPPQVRLGAVDEAFANWFTSTNFVPMFSFVDPWGYKGLSLQLVNGVIKNWGCDTVFFLNYNRVNMGFNNPAVKKHIVALFGEARTDEMIDAMNGMGSDKREAHILENLADAIKEMVPKAYVLPFRFRNEKGSRTSHILVFVSKHFRGYDIMKGIMAGESSTEYEGVPTFTYSPADKEYPLLFSLSHFSLSQLKKDLVKSYKGKTIVNEKLYEQHSVDTPYLRPNYREVILELEAEGRVTCSKHNRGTLAKHVEITFK
ncbi:MAG: three-Cys-motif partner protein TcmP [Rhodospirillales bacterium]|nr:MAG: three-Cys-motif partner protein TcmP [Rhodospirillales bacterium]